MLTNFNNSSSSFLGKIILESHAKFDLKLDKDINIYSKCAQYGSSCPIILPIKKLSCAYLVIFHIISLRNYCSINLNVLSVR